MATMGAQPAGCSVTGASWQQDAHPKLNDKNCQVTSPCKKSYNCIAWAATGSDQSDWWWPNPPGTPKVNYWPPGVPEELTVAAFVRAFETEGYRECKDGKLEAGFEKVAIYTKKTIAGEVPTHASRQLPDGKWTSKMGRLEDIEHNKPAHVTGPAYGGIALYMKRPLKAADKAGAEDDKSN
jgi:hypothetical protein